MISQHPPIKQHFLLTPCSKVVGGTPTVFSSSSLPQASAFWLPPLPWLLPPSLPSEPHVPHDGPLLPLSNEPEAIAPPYAIAAFHGATL